MNIVCDLVNQLVDVLSIHWTVDLEVPDRILSYPSQQLDMRL
jgi:hypothetical protein